MVCASVDPAPMNASFVMAQAQRIVKEVRVGLLADPALICWHLILPEI